jgi:hypothetical protein
MNFDMSYLYIAGILIAAWFIFKAVRKVIGFVFGLFSLWNIVKRHTLLFSLTLKRRYSNALEKEKAPCRCTFHPTGVFLRLGLTGPLTTQYQNFKRRDVLGEHLHENILNGFILGVKFMIVKV